MKDLNAYLQQLAAKGDRIAWVLLAPYDENGIVMIATSAPRSPADEVQQAIAQGRVLGTRFPRERRAA